MKKKIKYFFALIGVVMLTTVGSVVLADPTNYEPKVHGAFNPNVTQENIQETICVSGWTKTVRPPTSYTNKLKAQQMKDYGLTGEPKDYEEDHLVPLAVGGHPTDPNNLWPEPWDNTYFDARHKDRLERQVQLDVCSGKLTLEEGRKIFTGDVRQEYVKRYGEPK